MAALSVLHIGDDLCRRIPVMETAGFVVYQSEVKIPAIHIAFEREEGYSAVVFHNDIAAVPEDVVNEARLLSEAPFVLFQNPTVPSNEVEFDLVIPSLTTPDVWLLKLRELIQASRQILEDSIHLRQDCAATRSKSQQLRLASARKRVPPIDPDAIWRGSSIGSFPESKPPQAAAPTNSAKKRVS
jgi:hypothetical protein